MGAKGSEPPQPAYDPREALQGSGGGVLRVQGLPLPPPPFAPRRRDTVEEVLRRLERRPPPRPPSPLGPRRLLEPGELKDEQEHPISSPLL